MESSAEDLAKLWKTLQPKNGDPCVYCGLLSTDKEHVFPISWINSSKELFAAGFDIKIPKEVIVPSCRECNLIATDHLFRTFTEKKAYIREKLLKRYKKFMSFKVWTNEEINELSGNLCQQVFMFNEVAKVLKNRMIRLTK